MQRLDSSVCSGNGSYGVPSIIGKNQSPGDEDDSFTSLAKNNKKSKRTNDVNQLSSSIAKHGESLIAVAKINALQHEKDCIHSLCETRRNLVIRLASTDVMSNGTLANVISEEVKKIDEEISVLTLLLKSQE